MQNYKTESIEMFLPIILSNIIKFDLVVHSNRGLYEGNSSRGGYSNPGQ